MNKMIRTKVLSATYNMHIDRQFFRKTIKLFISKDNFWLNINLCTLFTQNVAKLRASSWQQNPDFCIFNAVHVRPPYKGRLCPKRVSFLGFKYSYERVGISVIEVYEREGKSVILVSKMT